MITTFLSGDCTLKFICDSLLMLLTVLKGRFYLTNITSGTEEFWQITDYLIVLIKIYKAGITQNQFR